MPVRPGVCRTQEVFLTVQQSSGRRLDVPSPRPLDAALESVSDREWTRQRLWVEGLRGQERERGTNSVCIALEPAPDREVHPQTSTHEGRKGSMMEGGRQGGNEGGSGSGRPVFLIEGKFLVT